MCCWVVVLVVWLDCVVSTKVVGRNFFKRYEEGKSSACRSGLVGVLFVSIGNLGRIISHYCIYGKD